MLRQYTGQLLVERGTSCDTIYIYCVIGLTSYWSSDAVGVKKLLRHCTDQLLVERGTVCKIYASHCTGQLLADQSFI